MNKKLKTLMGLVLFVVFLGVAYIAYATLSDRYTPNSLLEVAKATVDPMNSSEPEDTLEPASNKDAAPDFTVYDAQGNEIHLSDFIGKPVVLNFWASWCDPCKLEMPHFNTVYTEMNQDVIFMMVDLTDGQRETQPLGQAYVDEQGYDFPVYFDIDQEAAYAYQITSIPTTFFIDAKGNIVTMTQGAIEEDILKKCIALIKD